MDKTIMNIPVFLRLFYILKHHIYKVLNLKYYSIVDLVGRTGANGEKILIDSYYAFGLYPTSQGKSRYFVYSTSQAKSSHDGLSVISDTVPWDGTQSTLSDFLAGTGETSPGGSGAWVCKITQVDPFMAGAVGNNSVNDYAALQKAITYHVTNAIALFIPPTTFLTNSTLSVTGQWNIYGAGYRSAIRTADTTIPLFEFNINTTSVQRAYLSDFHFHGPQSTNVASCAMRFIGDNAAYIQYCIFSNLFCTEFNSFVKDEKSPRTTSFGFEAMLNWNLWNNINIFNTSSYGFWLTQGSGTGNTWQGIKPVLRGALAPTFFFDGVDCVVGDVIINNAHIGGRDSVSGSVGIKVGDSTTYRSRWSITSSQYDANCETPLELSSTGSTEYTNWKFINNNIGGAAELRNTNMPYMSQSIIEDKDVDLRQTGKRIDTGSTGAQTNDCFYVGVDSFGSSIVTVVANGLIGGVAACASEYQFRVTTDGATMTITGIESTVSNSGQLTWTCTSVDVNTAKLTLAYTPSSGGTKISTVAISRGHKHKLVRI
jgi:hypothetical protein